MQRRSPVHTTAIVVAAALPGVAGLAMGGIHPLLHILLSASALATLALLAGERWRSKRPLRLSWLGAPLLLGLVATLLALLPLPTALRALIDPEGADRIARAAALLSTGAASALRPVLAYDPPEAALAALRLLAGTACFLMVAHVGADARARRLAYGALAVVALVLFAVALAHAVGDVPQVWGRFGGAAALFHAPLVNPNHLGKAFSFFALLCLGRGLSMPRGGPAAVFVAIGVLCAAGVWLTDSRGSVLACGAGLLLLVVLLRASDRVSRALAVLAVLGVMLAALASTLGAQALADLAPLDPEGAAKAKLRILPFAWEVARAHALVGTGPGAFGVVLPSHLEIGALDASRFVYTHVENVVVQTFVDHGLALGTIFVIAAAWIAREIVVTGAARAAPGAAAALAALLIGELVDFAIELPSGLLLAAVALGLLAARIPAGRSVTTATPRTASIVVVALVVVAALVAPVAAGDWRRAVDREITSLRGAERAAVVERTFARHPSDAQYAYQLAVAARARRDPRAALAWVNRAISLWPAHRAAHVEAARALFALGYREQALLEYRTAWRCGRSDAALLAEVLERFAMYQDRRRAFLDDADSLEQLCRALLTPDAQTCFDELAALANANAAQRGAAVEHALARNDLDGALARLERTSLPVPAATGAALAGALARRDGNKTALARTQAWDTALTASDEFLLWRARAALAIGRDDIVDTALASLPASARPPAQQAAVRRVQAEVFEKRGQLHEAHGIVAALATLVAGDVELWLWQGRLELALGRSAQAADTARRAARAWPDDPRVHAFVSQVADGARPPAAPAGK